MRRRTITLAAGLTLVAAGAVAGFSVAGGNGPAGDARDAAAPLEVLDPVTAVARPAARAGSARKPTVQYFYAPSSTIPDEGEGLVQPLRCPRGKGEPITGGAQTSIGVVIAYLSRINPETGGRPRRTYFVGVEDLDATNAADSGGLVEIQCARNIRVRR